MARNRDGVAIQRMEVSAQRAFGRGGAWHPHAMDKVESDPAKIRAITNWTPILLADSDPLPLRMDGRRIVAFAVCVLCHGFR
jgi:hypothetical protein